MRMNLAVNTLSQLASLPALKGVELHVSTVFITSQSTLKDG